MPPTARFWGLFAMAWLALPAPAYGYDVTDRLAVGGVLSGALQCLRLSQPPDGNDSCRGAVPFQPQAEFRPDGRNTLFAKLGFASSNGLKNAHPFSADPWAADLEDDVKDIHGRGRNYLLTAWYRHVFHIAGSQALGITGGLIDATEYLDDNRYAGDEYTQFMNQALVSGPNGFFPSYDIGAAVEWTAGDFAVRGVYMNVGAGDSGASGGSFDFYALHVTYTLATRLGAGHYRANLAFDNPGLIERDTGAEERRAGLLFSFDQQLGDGLGAWARFGVQDETSDVTYGQILSGGLQLTGAGWGRPEDTVGIGYGHLSGGSLDVRHTEVAELYYRLVLLRRLGLSADLQHMTDKLRSGSSPKGFILSARGDLRF